MQSMVYRVCLVVKRIERLFQSRRQRVPLLQPCANLRQHGSDGVAAFAWITSCRGLSQPFASFHNWLQQGFGRVFGARAHLDTAFPRTAASWSNALVNSM